jgi:hypothetical protein
MAMLIGLRDNGYIKERLTRFSKLTSGLCASWTGLIVNLLFVSHL